MRELNVIFFFFLIFLFACSGSDKKKSNKVNLGVKITSSNMEKGGQLYRAKCMNCHLKTGKGIPKIFPPLANSDYLRKNTDEAIKMVKFGSNKPIKVNGIKYNSLMPASGLTDKELVLVFNYILNSWENSYGQVSLDEVSAIKR